MNYLCGHICLVLIKNIEMMKIKKSSILMLVILFTASVFSQEFQGIATYKSARKVDLKMDESSMNSEMQKQIAEQLKKQFQREYTLVFNKEESVYKINESLAKPNPISSGIQITIEEGTDILYKNTKENRFANETEIFGKQFLVKDTLENRKWKLVNETKNIGNYTCYKATFTEEYTTQTISDSNGLEKVTKERTTTAWYTPQIPINIGPGQFHGLPGLILEINDGEQTLVCSKIIMNPNETVEIKEPKKGKVVTQAKFDEIMDKKSKEMMDRMHSRKKNGENVMIQIGG